MSKPIAPACVPITVTLSKAYCGSVMRPSNEFEGTFTVHGTAHSLEQVARLIAAAPELLEQLQLILENNCIKQDGIHSMIVGDIKRLITKATGGAE